MTLPAPTLTRNTACHGGRWQRLGTHPRGARVQARRESKWAGRRPAGADGGRPGGRGTAAQGQGWQRRGEGGRESEAGRQGVKGKRKSRQGGVKGGSSSNGAAGGPPACSRRATQRGGSCEPPQHLPRSLQPHGREGDFWLPPRRMERKVLASTLCSARTYSIGRSSRGSRGSRVSSLSSGVGERSRRMDRKLLASTLFSARTCNIRRAAAGLGGSALAKLLLLLLRVGGRVGSSLCCTDGPRQHCKYQAKRAWPCPLPQHAVQRSTAAQRTATRKGAPPTASAKLAACGCSWPSSGGPSPDTT